MESVTRHEIDSDIEALTVAKKVASSYSRQFKILKLGDQHAYECCQLCIMTQLVAIVAGAIFGMAALMRNSDSDIAHVFSYGVIAYGVTLLIANWAAATCCITKTIYGCLDAASKTIESAIDQEIDSLT